MIIVSIPVTAEFKALLDRTKRTSTHIVVLEKTKQPYKAFYFRHAFRRAANKAGLKDLQFLDFRCSAVVRLAEAGCTIPQIAAITGHQLERTKAVLETYLPRNSEMAKAAIHTLESYRNRTKSQTS
ncbi:tyrosine-type recombinase/integrase [Defluviicoccus vanus]|uniref:Tyrosine-type recombinase/integrase n=1 Tax=Defluviicoccus vanus TaxID=111831 RepID=A0A7H1N6T4_9PROT|nr:tyrosine-type recombinase/integrase [Defluviicoccus vanus]